MDKTKNKQIEDQTLSTQDCEFKLQPQRCTTKEIMENINCYTGNKEDKEFLKTLHRKYFEICALDSYHIGTYPYEVEVSLKPGTCAKKLPHYGVPAHKMSEAMEILERLEQAGVVEYPQTGVKIISPAHLVYKAKPDAQQKMN